MTPETRFAQNGSVNIAYQVFGEGPDDLVIIPGWLSNLDLFWEEPMVARFFLGLASFSRVILIDKRGTGLSDRVPPPSLEIQMDDVKAVMDAAESETASMLGYSEGGTMCMLFAATYPDRTSSLILIGAYACLKKSNNCSYGFSDEERESWTKLIDKEWGGPIAIDEIAPSLANDERFRRWLAKYYRSSASKTDAAAMEKMSKDIDIRQILKTIRTPTLVLHSRGDLVSPIEAGRDIEKQIPNAKMIELDSNDHAPYVSCPEVIIDEVRQFIGGKQQPQVADRVLATILFTDIVGSTQIAANMGDLAWYDLLEEHHATIRRQLSIYRGQEIRSTGDGFFITFDGPARAIECAIVIRESIGQLGLCIRQGLHTGECEIRNNTLEGLAIHIAARVSSTAGEGQILTSNTVKDLVAGSQIKFNEYGLCDLKGVPNKVPLFEVEID